jgi:hypothetical protein
MRHLAPQSVIGKTGKSFRWSREGQPVKVVSQLLSYLLAIVVG